MNKQIIPIKQEHIDAGCRDSSSNCPIAIAIVEETKTQFVFVNEQAVCYWRSEDDKLQFRCSTRLAALITTYDNGNPMTPFILVLDDDTKMADIYTEACNCDHERYGYKLEEGNQLVKHVKGSLHRLDSPPAWAIQTNVVKAHQSVERFVIVDDENGWTYSASPHQLESYGFELERGYGQQTALTLKFWTLVKPGEEPAFQAQLF